MWHHDNDDNDEDDSNDNNNAYPNNCLPVMKILTIFDWFPSHSFKEESQSNKNNMLTIS